ncbi:MAG: hypothetical protein ACRD2E_05335 [Terriglobales bacterium]
MRALWVTAVLGFAALVAGAQQPARWAPVANPATPAVVAPMPLFPPVPTVSPMPPAVVMPLAAGPPLVFSAVPPLPDNAPFVPGEIAPIPSAVLPPPSAPRPVPSVVTPLAAMPRLTSITLPPVPSGVSPAAGRGNLETPRAPAGIRCRPSKSSRSDQRERPE